MSKIISFLENVVMAIVTRISGPAVVALSVILYAGIGLALPLALGWSIAGLVGANIAGTALAACVSLGSLVGLIEAGHRRRLVEWTTNLRLLSASEFEWLVGELFRREGWRVRETGRSDGPDGNIDLELTRDGQRVIVQCKRWVSWSVGVDEIRGFGGTLMREGLAGGAGVFVTLSDFTEQARTEARRIGMALVDNRELFSRIEKVRQAEPCPECQSSMILDRSSRGWWLRCVAAGCQGKRDLSNDPGRAVEVLTQTT